MKDNQAKYPQLRFKGFTNPWEKRKLGKWFAERTERSGEGEMLSVTISSGVVRANSLDRKDNSSTDKSNYKVVHIGDIAYNSMRMWQAASGVSNYDGIVSPAYTVLVPAAEVSSVFFGYQFKQTKMKQIFQRNSQGLTSDTWNLKYPLLAKIKTSAPQKTEQVKIGTFFATLDHLIAVNQRKLAKLKELKQGYLQKMFPQNGSKFPQLRFAGFADAWEQRKLGEIAIRVRGNDGRMNLPTLTISAGNGWMDQRDRFSQNIAGKEQKNYTLLRQGELSYNHGNSKLAQFGAVFELESYNEALVPRVYHSFSVTAGAQPKFIEQMFATHRPDRELRKLVSSGARMDGLLNINYDDFMGIKVWLPSVAEQQAISGLLVKLDNTIALHQRKLEKLQELKKGYLQKMFC